MTLTLFVKSSIGLKSLTRKRLLNNASPVVSSLFPSSTRLPLQLKQIKCLGTKKKKGKENQYTKTIVYSRDSSKVIPNIGKTINKKEKFAQFENDIKNIKGDIQRKLNEEEDQISVDQSGMFNPDFHLINMPDFSDKSLGYEESTPLGEKLVKVIGLRGPITTHDFMQMALTDPSDGYYTTKDASKEANGTDLYEDLFDDEDVEPEEKTEKDSSSIIGKKGDFITAPEISQTFGESILLFYIHQYRIALKSPAAINLVEVGPGKGTLMVDILRAACNSFHDFATALSSPEDCEEKEKNIGVHLVEVSSDMKMKQKASLEEMSKTISSYKFEYYDNGARMDDDDEEEVSLSNKKIIRVYWHDTLEQVPTDYTPMSGTSKKIPHFIVCQEFLDALPIHSFQKHSDGSWRERMIDVEVKVDADDEDKHMDEKIIMDALPDQKKKPRFRFVLSKESTPAAKSLLHFNQTDNNGDEKNDDRFSPGDVLEVNPGALIVMQDISKRVSECRGASLIFDYGTMYGSGDTLRGFYKHKQIHPLSLPGKIDVTADVTFGALKQEVERYIKSTGGKVPNSQNLSCLGPTTQGEFLIAMGAPERVIGLIEDDSTSEEQAEELFSGLERLINPDEMGERFKVLGIVSGGGGEAFNLNTTAPGFPKQAPKQHPVSPLSRSFSTRAITTSSSQRMCSSVSDPNSKNFKRHKDVEFPPNTKIHIVEENGSKNSVARQYILLPTKTPFDKNIYKTDESMRKAISRESIGSLYSSRNIIFGATSSKNNNTSCDKTTHLIDSCGGLVDTAAAIIGDTGEQVQAIARLDGLSEWVAKEINALNSGKGNSEALAKIKEDEIMYEAVTAIATGIPRSGHKVVGQGTFRDGEAGWIMLAEEYVAKGLASEVELYKSRNGISVETMFLADTSEKYLKEAGGTMIKLFLL